MFRNNRVSILNSIVKKILCEKSETISNFWSCEKWYRFVDNEDAGSEHGGGGHGHAHSFHHFSGPVVGHHEEITWKDKHGHLHHDYRAHPKYKFAYGVEDKHTKDYHGQKEHRDGTSSIFNNFVFFN